MLREALSTDKDASEGLLSIERFVTRQSFSFVNYFPGSVLSFKSCTCVLSCFEIKGVPKEIIFLSHIDCL